MKLKSVLSLFLLGATAIAISSCALFQSAVPTTQIKGEIGGQSFSISTPKNTTLSNLNVSVSTNGTATVSIGTLSSTNDSNVVSAAYSGQAALVDSAGNAAIKAFQAGASLASTVAGAAAK